MRPHFSWFCALLLVLFVVGCGGGGSNAGPTGTHWNIGASGGTFHTSDNNVRLVVPAGSVASNTTVTVAKLAAPTPPSGKVYVPGSAWSFTHVNFTTPATLTMTFPATTTTPTLKLYRRADGASEWTPVATSVSAAAHTATAEISSFSSYALFYNMEGWGWTSAGGTFTFETLSVLLPPDGVLTDVAVEPRRTPAPFTPPAGWTAVTGATFDLGSSNTSLHTANPFTVTITYDAGALPLALRDNAKIFYKENDAAEWMMLTSTSEAANLKVSAASSTLGTFAVFYPTPAPTSVYWVEQRSQINDIFLDVYSAEAGGSESLAYSPAQMQGMSQLRTNTFRWSDRSYVGLEFANSTDTYLMSYNVATNTSTRLFLVPHDAGTIFSAIEPVRANRVAGGDDLAVQVSQRNSTTGAARDRLLLFRDGGSDPLVLLSHDRTDGDSPAIMRPWDVSADGRVLALTSGGLVMFTGTSQTVLSHPNRGPGEAYFSPSGERVLFVQHSGTEPGWKVITLSTGAVAPVTGLTNGTMVRWGADDTHVLEAATSGPDRQIHLVDIAHGTATLITTAGDHATSFINDLGVR